MSHLVCRKNRYWSLEESYREGKRVRKRTLFYFGTRRPTDPQARYQQMIDTAERKGQEIDDAQRAKFGESGEERAERLKEEAKFSQQKFLERTNEPPEPLAQASEVKDDASGDNAQDGEIGAGDEGGDDGLGESHDS